MADCVVCQGITTSTNAFKVETWDRQTGQITTHTTTTCPVCQGAGTGT